MKGLVSTSQKQGNYGTPVAYRGQAAYRPRRPITKKNK